MTKGPLNQIMSWFHKDKKNQSKDSHLSLDVKDKSEKKSDSPLSLSFATTASERSAGLKKQKFLVLDLDETLIHAEAFPFKSWTHSIEINYRGQDLQYYVSVRPGLKKFLKEMSKYYTIHIYTCSDIGYAESLLKKIGMRKYFSKLFTRADCIKNGKELNKDISVIGEDLSSVILLDDSERHIKANSANGLRVKGYYQDTKDRELSEVGKFLKKLWKCQEVRSVTKQWELHKAGKPLDLESKHIFNEEAALKWVLDNNNGQSVKISGSQEDSSPEANLVLESNTGAESSSYSAKKMDYPVQLIHDYVDLQ